MCLSSTMWKTELAWFSASRLPWLYVKLSVALAAWCRCRRDFVDEVLLDVNDTDNTDDELTTNGKTDALPLLTMFDSFADLHPRDFGYNDTNIMPQSHMYWHKTPSMPSFVLHVLIYFTCWTKKLYVCRCLRHHKNILVIYLNITRKSLIKAERR